MIFDLVSMFLLKRVYTHDIFKDVTED